MVNRGWGGAYRGARTGTPMLYNPGSKFFIYFLMYGKAEIYLYKQIKKYKRI